MAQKEYILQLQPTSDALKEIDRSPMRDEELSPRLEGLPGGIPAQERDIPRSLMEEMLQAKAKAVADGAFMRTPSGEASTLSETEWLVARTRSFRDGYGIWERDVLTAEILKNGINSVSLRLLKTISDYGQNGERINERVPSDRRILERVSRGLHRDRDGFCRRNDEAALIVRGSEGTDSQVSAVEDYDRQVRYAQRQRPLLEQWAKANDIWYDDTDNVLSARFSFLAREGEASVYYDQAENLAYKSIGLDYYVSPSLALDRINLHNRLFPHDFLELVGCGTDADGRFCLVCRQPFIHGTAPTAGEIDSLARNLGFRSLPDKDSEYVSNDIYLGDLHTGNILKDASGILHVFDSELRLNTPGLGYGGKHILPTDGPSRKLSPSGEPSAEDIRNFIEQYKQDISMENNGKTLNGQRTIASPISDDTEIRIQRRGPALTFLEDDSPYYKVRTKRNADAADVTLAFAADFTTAGERCTRNVAGDRYLAVSLPSRRYFNAPESGYAKAALKGIVEDIEAGIMGRAERFGFSPTEVNVNVAGNGSYTLRAYGISQEEADRFITDVFRLIEDRHQGDYPQEGDAEKWNVKRDIKIRDPVSRIPPAGRGTASIRLRCVPAPSGSSKIGDANLAKK